MNKIIQVLNLFRSYKLGAFRILFSILLGRPVQIKVKGKWFLQNLDKSTVYHLLNSYSKIERLVQALPAQIEGVAIDGGANNGLFSLFLNQRFPETPIFAFEPSDALLPFLQKNLEIDHVEIRKEALAEINGEISFFFSEDADQIGSIHRENVEEFEKNPSRIGVNQVAAITLDSFIQEKGIERIGVLKLDVQGAELSILKGAQKALEITDCILIEIMLLEPSSFELLDLVRKRFPYHKVINPVSYGADMLFSKEPIR